jgi:hypothetical protein
MTLPNFLKVPPLKKEARPSIIIAALEAAA